LRAVFPGQEPIERSSMNSWDDRNFVAAIEKSGRKKIVLAGLWTEICVALPTVQAIHDGITGTHWSGPLFFGIKSEQTNSKSKEAR